jgi:hypothetical protein
VREQSDRITVAGSHMPNIKIKFFYLFIFGLIILTLYIYNILFTEVQYIIDSVVTALDQNPNRRFIYVEIGYFWRWWNEQTDDIRQKVKGFVNDGKIHQMMLRFFKVVFLE